MSVLSSISALKSKINQYIKANYQQLITGPIINSILHDSVDTLNNAIESVKTVKVDKTAIGYDSVHGLNLPAGATYKINGVDIISTIVNGGGSFVGDFNASPGSLPTTGTGAAGAIKKGDFWRISTGGTITGLLPNPELTPGDVIYSKADGAATVADFFSVEGNQDIAALLSRLTAAETKLATIEENATGDQTATEIKTALETLAGDDRLDQSAVKNIESAPFDNETFPELNTLLKAINYLLLQQSQIVTYVEIEDAVPANANKVISVGSIATESAVELKYTAVRGNKIVTGRSVVSNLYGTLKKTEDIISDEIGLTIDFTPSVNNIQAVFTSSNLDSNQTLLSITIHRIKKHS